MGRKQEKRSNCKSKLDITCLPYFAEQISKPERQRKQTFGFLLFLQYISFFTKVNRDLSN